MGGPTDPAQAPADSLRGQILANWKDLGLASEPNTGDNGMHASASPFEGLAERNNWLQAAITNDMFGKLLIGMGIVKKIEAVGSQSGKTAKPVVIADCGQL